MIISTATESLCKKCNADVKEKLACEIYELITTTGLPLVLKLLLIKDFLFMKKKKEHDSLYVPI